MRAKSRKWVAWAMVLGCSSLTMWSCGGRTVIDGETGGAPPSGGTGGSSNMGGASGGFGGASPSMGDASTGGANAGGSSVGGAGGTVSIGTGGRGGRGGAGGAAGSAGSGGSGGPSDASIDRSMGTGGATVLDARADADASDGARGTTDANCGVTPAFDAGSPGTVLFADDFEPDSAAVGWISAATSVSSQATWSVTAGDTSRVFVETPPFFDSNVNVAINGDVRWTDVSIEARVKVTNIQGVSTANFAGVCARFADLSNFYCGVLRTDGRPAIRARIAASGTTLASGVDTVLPAGSTNLWVTVKLLVRGGTLNLYVNDAATPSATITDCAISRGGIALVASGVAAQFDDVRVTVP